MKKIIAVIIATLSAGLLLTAGVSATSSNVNYKGGDNVTLERSKVVNGAYYTSGDTVTIAGTVKGDLYCAGKTVFVTGTIEGDVFCAAQTIKIAGNVDGDVRVAGQTVTIDGITSRNVTVFGEVVDVAKTAIIGRDLNGASNSVTVDGKVGRDVTIGGNTVSILGIIGRDVGVASENLTINEEASVAGWVRYTSQNEASIAEGSVKGEVKYTKKEDDAAAADSNAATISSFIYMLLAFAILSLGIVLIAPQQVHAVGITGIKRLGMSILLGIFALLAVPILLVLLALTFIGMPLALLLGLVWILLLVLSGPMFAYYLGRLLLRKHTDNAIWTMLVGAAMVVVLFIIPIVNVIVGLTSLILGMGMVSLYVMSRLQKPHYTVK
ncbi:MAG TPA: polymer-forming cytoskeletal protein [Candidatus Saccharimonadales bacterium]|nr:polymer-forming cytoskeletal protein [Candidatus Saccharimonadales bacterium]